MSDPSARIHRIPAGHPFLPSLAKGLIARAGEDPLTLVAMTVLLPTRRACRALRDVFLALGEGRAALLPRLVPLGDVADQAGEDMLFGAEAALTGALDLPPAMPALRRLLLLAEKIDKQEACGLAQAVFLAKSLGRMLDEVATGEVDLGALRTIGPRDQDHAAHWQRTLHFLAILQDAWPKILAETGTIEASARRVSVLRNLAAAWAATPPGGMIVLAGSTGSVKATHDLIRVVADLPNGLVVLPELDQDPIRFDAARAIEAHPQHMLTLLLGDLGCAPDAVPPWPDLADPILPPARATFLHAAFASVPDFALTRNRAVEALAGVTRIDCRGPAEEAQVIALLMREVLETSDRMAALVTPDRDLARRVACELGRFGIAIDDAAGIPLTRTPPFAYLRLLADVVESGFAPVPLLSFLKHPLTALGLAPGACRDLARQLERAVLRGPRAKPGLDELRNLLDLAGRRTALGWFVDRLDTALGDFRAASGGSLAHVIDALVLAGERAAASDTESGADRLWAGEAGEAVAEFIADLRATGLGRLRADPQGLARLIDVLAGERELRPRFGRHSRLSILGPRDARLQSFDRLILAGLNEGVWPSDPAADPWLSRPLRRELGLPSTERRIGQSAHDFVEALCAAREVYLTRSERVEGTPTVPSRWLQRLDLATPAGFAWTDPRPLAAWASMLDAPDAVRPMPRPTPAPPVSARPREVWVTDVELWLANPYGFYAKRILALRKLEPIDAAPSPADRGRILHGALDEFVREYPAVLPPDAWRKIVDLVEAKLQELEGSESMRAFWLPRLRRIARWIVEEEAKRRPLLARIATEIEGRREIAFASGSVTLRGKADRVELGRDGSLAIIDYKTGSLPTNKALDLGHAPQLALLGVIAAAGGFPELPAVVPRDLALWPLTGSREGVKPRRPSDAPAAIDQALAGFVALVEAFARADQPYLPIPRPGRAPNYDDYAHLARIQEWSTVESE